MSRDDDEPSRSRRWNWLAPLVCLVPLVCLIPLIAMFAWTQWSAVPRPPIIHPDHPLIGTWTLPNPQGPGTTRYNTFNADGTFVGKDYADATGAILQDLRASWRLEDNSLVLKFSRTAPGKSFQITAITSDELHIGGMIYKRVDEGAKPK